MTVFSVSVFEKWTLLGHPEMIIQTQKLNSIETNCINLNAKEMVSVGRDILVMGRLQSSPAHLYRSGGNWKAEQPGIDWCSLTQNRGKRF